MKYLNWNKQTISDFSGGVIDRAYNDGYVFTRTAKGAMDQTRSVRIDLKKFELTSENRRVIKKTEGLSVASKKLPLSDYDFTLGKLAKDFYDTKFGAGIMSAQKIKEMLTDASKSNFNVLLTYSLPSETGTAKAESNAPTSTSTTPTAPAKNPCGYAICFASESILHYSYPFYDLTTAPKDMGLGMMLRAILHAKELNLKYVYLGSLQRPGDVYKLQFDGLEWFDGKVWKTDVEEVKRILGEASPLQAS